MYIIGKYIILHFKCLFSNYLCISRWYRIIDLYLTYIYIQYIYNMYDFKTKI